MISHPQMITASAFLHSFRSFSLPFHIYFNRERKPLGISVTNVILSTSINWLKNFLSRSGLYAAIIIFFHSSSNSLTVHSKISSSPRFLYDRLPTMRMCFSGMFNVFGMRIVPKRIKKDYMFYIVVLSWYSIEIYLVVVVSFQNGGVMALR